MNEGKDFTNKNRSYSDIYTNQNFENDSRKFSSFELYSKNILNEKSKITSKPKKKLIKNPFLLISVFILSILGVGFTTYGIYSTTESFKKLNNFYSTTTPVSGEYNIASDASYWISERTLSLQFQYQSKTDDNGYESWTESGTGWIYSASKSTNTYYVATNFHVAKILTLLGKTIIDSNGQTITYGSNILSSIGIVGGLDKKNNNITSTNKLLYFNVSIPTIAYTTLADNNFNNVFNEGDKKNYNGYYDGKLAKFKGISDLAILKYIINPNKISNNDVKSVNWNISSKQAINYFKNWIDVYFQNPTVIYDKNMESIDINQYSLNMGGFPMYDARTNSASSQDASITWLPFSNFGIHETFSPGYKTWSNPLITFYPKNVSSSSDYTDYNFQSIGLLTLFKANSYGGSSGSPIVINFGTKANPKYEVVGIYWGSSSSYGAMTWFATNNYILNNSNNSKSVVSYNLIFGINKIVLGY